jgi:hypothetical protein
MVIIFIIKTGRKIDKLKVVYSKRARKWKINGGQAKQLH